MWDGVGCRACAEIHAHLPYDGEMRVCSLSIVSLALVACGDDAATPDAKPIDAIDYTIGEHPQLARACSDSLADIYVLPTDLPAMDDTHRGDVFRCAISEKLTVPEIEAQITASNLSFMNTAPGIINSGFWTYRFAYRTTRNTVGTTRAEGDSAAMLFIPAKPLAGAPLIVFGHGSLGFAPQCAPSHLDLSATATGDNDWPPQLYRLAAYGYTVVATDYNGFSYGQPPGYFNAEDEAHAILDATRAAAQLLPSPPTKVAFVGHSQGGHAVISAHAYAKTYGMQGELIGVATLAPIWSSMSIWASATTSLAGLSTATDTGAIMYAMAYAYSASELREGAGHGLDVFQTDKQAAAKEAFLGGECYDKAKQMALGATPADFFETNYVDIVGYACATNPFGSDCSDPLAQKWKARWVEDRPAIDPMGAPLLITFGGSDTFVPTGRANCSRNKLTKDLMVTGATTQIQYCYNSKATHRDIIRGTEVDYLNKWIAAKAGAGEDPGSCTPFPVEQCATPPHDY
jgi:pimeloyl-ACP methyl ester carboxylesterase